MEVGLRRNEHSISMDSCTGGHICDHYIDRARAGTVEQYNRIVGNEAFQPFRASNPKEAFRAVHASRPDLVLLAKA
jgi:hypothetical protein